MASPIEPGQNDLAFKEINRLLSLANYHSFILNQDIHGNFSRLWLRIRRASAAILQPGRCLTNPLMIKVKPGWI
jgi:hypothetical protein